MGINITALNNITPYTVNNSLINNSTEITINLINNANTQTQNYLGLGIMVILFLVLLIILMADQEIFRLKFMNAFVISTGIPLVLGIIMLVSGIITDYRHIIWFALLFIIGLLGKYYEDK